MASHVRVLLAATAAAAAAAACADDAICNDDADTSNAANSRIHARMNKFVSAMVVVKSEL